MPVFLLCVVRQWQFASQLMSIHQCSFYCYLQEELDTLAERYPSRFTVYYVLNQPPEVWDDGVAFVSKEMIQTYCPAPASDIYKECY
ncbi:hypothetical protein D5086_033216 [Populus alba]|uniref:Uncharacterized protein n=1 Tax=Populus alba TaxID=43335 RepID=A0ACC4AGB8_POPAL